MSTGSLRSSLRMCKLYGTSSITPGGRVFSYEGWVGIDYGTQLRIGHAVALENARRPVFHVSARTWLKTARAFRAHPDWKHIP